MLDHRLAADPQHEELAVAGEVDRYGEQLLDVLLGEHVGAGGDVADERDVADRAASPAWRRCSCRTGPRSPEAWSGRDAGSRAAERVEVAVHGRGGGEADGVADLAHRWRIATIADLLFDELQDVSLTGTDRMGHANSVRAFADQVKHLFHKQLFENLGRTG